LTKQKDIFTLIKQLTGQANVLTIPKAFILYTGSIEAALLLSQIIYWSDRGRRGDGWFWKSYKDWEDELCLSAKKLRKAVNVLKSMGIIKTKLQKANGNPTLHYLFCEDAFISSFCLFGNNQCAQTAITSNRDYTHINGKPKSIAPITYMDHRDEENPIRYFNEENNPDHDQIL